ncbi:MAG: hypothetical protein F4X35_02235 [Alphaproteobacteria bacterium]|nr:hypothetical protein [Alphaproteobacteria bacterium]
MSRRWSARSPAERQRLEAEFVGIHGAQLLLDPESALCSEAEFRKQKQPARQLVSFSQMYAAVLGGGPLPADISEALRTDPAFRDEFELLLRRNAWLRMPRVAAAAGKASLDRRDVDGCVVRLVASQTRRGQVYLLIELSEEAIGRGGASWRTPAEKQDAEPDATGGTGAARPAQIVVHTASGECLKRVLAPPDARTIRLVMEADDPLVLALAEPSSEVFLL